MPSAHYQRVKAFMRSANQDTPSKVTIPDRKTRELRAGLILEEALETIASLGFRVEVKKGFLRKGNYDFDPAYSCDLEGVADGCADISVVTMGTLIAFGIDDELLLEEVDESNMRKFGEGGYCREDGKWIKPPDWEPPDIETAIFN